MLTQDQILELSRWARGIVERGNGGELVSLAEQIVPLAHEAAHPSVTHRRGDELAQLRRRAEAVMANGAPDELRAAAKAVLLLCDHLASAEPAAETPPAAVAPVRTRQSHSPRRRLLLFGGVAAAAGALFMGLILPTGSKGLDPAGPPTSVVGADALSRLAFSVSGGETDLAETTWLLDGRDVSNAAVGEDGRIVYRPGKATEGTHRLEVSRPGSSLFSHPSAEWAFVVDTKAPRIRVARSSLEAPRGQPYRLRGAVEPGAAVTVNGDDVTVDARGRFAVSFGRMPSGIIVIRAHDAAGNLADSRFTVATAPRLPRNPVRAVHVSADAWAYPALRAGVLALIDQRRVNAVELDLKDESGIVGWASGVPLARRVGAERRLFDLRQAVASLHARGVRVIGRIVAFRDPVLAAWAWKNGRRRLVVQTTDGGAYSGGYGGFTNFADPTVREYNVGLAEAAAKRGIDEILYDYVRRPDGPIGSMVFPGLSGDPAQAVTALLTRSRERLARHGTFLGASVFGIAATRPDEIAQDVPAIARQVDYVAPMLYPSHWGADEYGLANPDTQPYQIVRRSLRDFRKAVRGTGARLVPWLQDFSLGSQYGPAEVRAQVDAARDAGIDEFLLWDPRVTYTGQALRRNASFPTTGTRAVAPGAGRLVVLPQTRFPDDPVPSGLAPNELGVVPVVMYHQLRPDGGSEYDLTPEQFRAELERLYRAHYRPVNASDLVKGSIDLPRGASPVVLTFDDSTASQAGLLPNGRIDPGSAAGIMLAFARAHPDFRPAGTFYVNRAPFADAARAGDLARRLVALGFELGNHTRDHVRLDQLGAAGVQRQIVLGNRVIRELLPGAEVETIALPFGLQPDPPGLALGGSWGGESYAFAGAFLAGAEPAPSPFAARFQPLAIPRIRTDPGTLENGSSDWLRRLAASPESRYVSDGNARRITIPQSLQGSLAARFRSRVQTR